jgi:DNA topoisomerase VI subunit B
MVATFKEAPAVFEGHCFIVEGGVCLGGEKAKEGVTVYRFANRIPLLFESGADVATRTAMKRIRLVLIATPSLSSLPISSWSSYKIDHKRDKVGVFISIVSTKIPFKGTGKEYIGDDIEVGSFKTK